MSGRLTTEDKLELIDDYLMEPNNITPTWVSMLREYRAWLAVEPGERSAGMDVPITEKLRLIDEYLAFPSENDPRWMVMIREYREYVEMERAMENEN